MVPFLHMGRLELEKLSQSRDQTLISMEKILYMEAIEKMVVQTKRSEVLCRDLLSIFSIVLSQLRRRLKIQLNLSSLSS